MSISDFENMFLVRHVKGWYLRFERPISSLSLVGGFVFDIFALKRVDEPLENLWVGLHLLVAAIGIILVNLFDAKSASAKKRRRLSERSREIVRFWCLFIVQFAFGGLLSVFLVFYFRSATLATSWPFFILLAAAFVANERLKEHYSRLVFQIAMFFLSTYAFAIYIVPVLMHRVGDDVFLLSGLASVAVLGAFLWLLRTVSRQSFAKNRLKLALALVGMIAAINGLYFLNIIPPIPLSLQDAGVFHSITKNSAGNYVLQGEPRTWLDYFNLAQTVNTAPGQPLYAWSAIFSPTSFSANILHVWQYYDAAQKKWITSSRIPLYVVGGREDGFRTYSVKSNLFPGLWRVNVETSTGQVLGRMKFNVVNTILEPQLQTEIK